MPTYLVAPPDDPQGWTEDAEAFAAALLEEWPGATVRPSPADSPMTLYFELPGPGGYRHLGSLDGDRTCVNLEFNPPLAAEVAAWWRRRVPAHVNLVFFDEGYNADVAVTTGVDGETLAAAYHEAAVG